MDVGSPSLFSGIRSCRQSLTTKVLRLFACSMRLSTNSSPLKKLLWIFIHRSYVLRLTRSMNGFIRTSIVCLTYLFPGSGQWRFSDGVYRSGFATTQAAYEKAVVELFDALDKVEKLLTGKDFLIGDRLTEADIRLWVTIVWFLSNIPSNWLMLSADCLLDSFRSCLCRTFQV